MNEQERRDYMKRVVDTIITLDISFMDKMVMVFTILHVTVDAELAKQPLTIPEIRERKRQIGKALQEFMDRDLSLDIFFNQKTTQNENRQT